MPTEFCQKCKQSHPGRACDYDDQGDCAETVDESKEEKSDAAKDGFSSKKRANER